MSFRLLVLNGPNLNLLGTREPAVYGASTLADVEALVRAEAGFRGWETEFLQSNHEGVLLDAVHAARDTSDAIILNPGALTHTSIALRDAVAGIPLPVIEVHLSNVHAREEYRHRSYVAEVAAATIVGAGPEGYLAALYLLDRRLRAAA